MYGARLRSLLFAAGEPQRTPEFALRNTTRHAEYPVAGHVAGTTEEARTGGERCAEGGVGAHGATVGQRPVSSLSGPYHSGVCRRSEQRCGGGEVAHTVGLWRDRFIAEGVVGLGDEPRPGAPREIGDEKVEQVVRLALEKTPKGATH